MSEIERYWYDRLEDEMDRLKEEEEVRRNEVLQARSCQKVAEFFRGVFGVMAAFMLITARSQDPVIGALSILITAGLVVTCHMMACNYQMLARELEGQHRPWER